MNPESILDAVRAAANTSLVVNLIMHLLVLAAVLSLFLVTDTKTKRYIFDGTLFILATSVAIMSIVSGNPFNLITFVVIAIVSVVEVIRRENQISRPTLNFNSIVCFVFILVGFVYPEFVNANAVVLPIVSPLGAIPCATLLVILGMLNLLVPQVNKTQFIVITVLGLFYGVTGVFQLKVYLDIALLILVFYSLYNFRFVVGKKKLPSTI